MNSLRGSSGMPGNARFDQARLDPAPLAQARLDLCRRRFLLNGLAGAGAAALSSLLAQDGIQAAEPARPARPSHDPTLPRMPHFAPRAKRIIYIYLEGGPSQMDLFDPKPQLNKLDGQPLPASM